MTDCRPPTCGIYRIDVVDRLTGATIHRLEREMDWRAQWTKAENAIATIQLELSTVAECCSLQLIPWRHEFKVFRDHHHCMTYLFRARVPSISDGKRVVTFFGVSLMWIYLQRLWLRTLDATYETTTAFGLLLDEADKIDPIGIYREPKPIGQNVKLTASTGDPLANAFNQLTSGTLEWVEYGLANCSQAVRFGNTAYNTGLTVQSDWWETPVEPSQDGSTLASVVRVVSEPETLADGTTTGLVVGWWPPLNTNGTPNRGSLDIWIPQTVTVTGLTTESEANAVAKRIWEKSQNPNFIDDATTTLTKRANGFCPCDIQPGAIFGAALDTDCADFATDLRLTQLTVDIESGKEVSVSPTFIAGQA